jgi:hypothetical protein
MAHTYYSLLYHCIFSTKDRKSVCLRDYETVCYSSQCKVDPVRTFKTKWLARFARREGITDKSLREAIERAERGLIDADLGGGLIKQRVARQGQGRSGGYRTIIAYRAKERAVFLLGFAKNEQENISSDELRSFRQIAEKLLAEDEMQIRKDIEAGTLQEIGYGDEN